MAEERKYRRETLQVMPVDCKKSLSKRK